MNVAAKPGNKQTFDWLIIEYTNFNFFHHRKAAWMLQQKAGLQHTPETIDTFPQRIYTKQDLQICLKCVHVAVQQTSILIQHK